MGSSAPPTGQPKPMQPGEFHSESQAALVSWKFRDVEIPSPLYIARDDQIVLRSLAAVVPETFVVTGRLLTIDGVVIPVQASIVNVTVLSPLTSVISGVEGFLLGISVTATVATSRGQAFVRVWLNRGPASAANCAQLLLSDYVTAAQQASWPLGSPKHPTEGPGLLQTFTYASPGAGADFNVTLFTTQRSRVVSFLGILTTSAAAANRNVEVILTDGAGNPVYRASATASIPASTTARVCFVPGAQNAGVVTTDVMVPLPELPTLPSSIVMATNTVNIQAADQWSALRMLGETWIDTI